MYLTIFGVINYEFELYFLISFHWFELWRHMAKFGHIKINR